MSEAFSYNGYALRYVLTEAYEFYPEYGPGGVDHIWDRVRLTVAGVIHQGLPPSTGSETPAQTIARIKEELLTPRRPLTYSVGGTVIYDVPGVDASGVGPQVGGVQCSDMLDGGILVRMTVEFASRGCSSIPASAQPVFISNRWHQAEEYDAAGYCTRRISGVAVLRSDLRVVGTIEQSADTFRGFAVPSVREGYQRLASQYTLSEDGLRLAWSATDKEYYMPPPLIAEPATGAATRAIEVAGAVVVTSNPTGTRHFVAANVKVSAGKGILKSTLIDITRRIARNQVGQFLQGAGQSGVNPIIKQDIYNDLYKNEVEYRLHSELSAKGVEDFLRSGVNKIPRFSEDTRVPGIAPPVRGLGGFVELLASLFQDPCVTVAALQAGLSLRNAKPMAANTLPGVEPARIDIGPVNTGPAGISVGTPEASDAFPYGVYRVRMSYAADTRMRVLQGSGREAATGTAVGKALPHPTVSLGNATLRLIVTWAAERVGLTPDIPDPCPGVTATNTILPTPGQTATPAPPANYVLETFTIDTEEVEQIGTGKLRYRISGIYTYGVRLPCEVPIVNARPPFLIPVAVLEPGASGPRPLSTSVLPAARGPASKPPAPPLPGVIQDAVSTVAAIESAMGVGASATQQRILDVSPVGSRTPGIYRTSTDIVWGTLKLVKPSGVFCDGTCDPAQRADVAVILG